MGIRTFKCIHRMEEGESKNRPTYILSLVYDKGNKKTIISINGASLIIMSIYRFLKCKQKFILDSI